MTPGGFSPTSEHPLSDELLRDIIEEFPRFRIVPKRGDWFQAAVDLALRALTFGAQHRYSSHYHTVMGYTLYVPDSWPALPDLGRVVLLRHERVHLRQRRRFGFLLFAFLYLVPFVPLGLAYGRARLEWEAYRETLRATAELMGPERVASSELRAEIVRRFVGADYGWMWPFPAVIHRWIDEELRQLTKSGT